jgi:hypothetical protein
MVKLLFSRTQEPSSALDPDLPAENVALVVAKHVGIRICSDIAFWHDLKPRASAA